MFGLSQATYINQILTRFSMQDSKKGFLPFRHGITLSKDQCPKKLDEIENMKAVPYASTVEALCMKCFALDLTSALLLALDSGKTYNQVLEKDKRLYVSLPGKQSSTFRVYKLRLPVR